MTRKNFFILAITLLLLTAGCRRSLPDQQTMRSVTDMAGRTVMVPLDIESAFTTDPTSAIYLYTLAPDQLLGWNYGLNDIEKSVILEKYHNLPNFGMGDSINYEAVIAAAPTVAIHLTAIGSAAVEEADKLSASLGIPVLVVSDQLADVPEVYRFLGEVFTGAQEQGEKLAAYAEDTFQAIVDMDIAEADKLRVYYGNGPESLQTAPAGSTHGQIIDAVNAVNAADLELGSGSRMNISLEQLLAWDPDVIVVNGEPKANLSGCAAAEAILGNPDFAALKAVQNGAVYGAPNAPFSWVDRPHGPNRIVGIRWLAGLLYPDSLAYDVDSEVKEFFRLFYHVELSDEQLEKIYQGKP